MVSSGCQSPAVLMTHGGRTQSKALTKARHTRTQELPGHTREHIGTHGGHIKTQGGRKSRERRYHHFHEDFVFLLLFFTVSRQCYNHNDIGYQIHYTEKMCINQP